MSTISTIENELVRKLQQTPDETRQFKDGKGKLDVFHLGDSTVGRGEFEPGWRWSQHIKPIAGTPSCQAAHTCYVLEGRMHVSVLYQANEGDEEFPSVALFLNRENGVDYSWSCE